MSDTVFGPGPADRPSHDPDFGRIVESILWFDGESREGGKTFVEIVSELAVNPRTVEYLARQRVIRTPKGQAADMEGLITMVLLWMEGFYVALRYAREQAKQGGTDG